MKREPVRRALIRKVGKNPGFMSIAQPSGFYWETILILILMIMKMEPKKNCKMKMVQNFFFVSAESESLKAHHLKCLGYTAMFCNTSLCF